MANVIPFLQVYGEDKESGANADSVVAEITNSIPEVDQITVAEWKRTANIKASLCWGTIFMLLFNWYFHFLF